MKIRCAAILYLLVLMLASGVTWSQTRSVPMVSPSTPRVLIVVAHPDDESCFSATVYEITHNLGGQVDQLVVTNGEGGFRYSLLAEPYYGVSLTTETVGRAALPDIRKLELLGAGKILGISKHFFLDEPDARYTQDVQEVLSQHWHSDVVLAAIKRRLEAGHYDFVFTLFPTADTHGGHKAATFIALQAVAALPGKHPVVLGCQDSSAKDTEPLDWTGFQSDTYRFAVAPGRYSVDRNYKFGFNNLLSYQIIANWVIAEHKSQGAFQTDINRFDKEDFAILDSLKPEATAQVQDLFRHLQETLPAPLPKP